MKVIGYLVFSCIFYICRIFPINPNKVFCIMTHDGSWDSNVGMVINYLKETKRDYRFYYIKKKQVHQIKRSSKLTDILDFFIRKPYHLATSSYVLQDNIFLPMAFMHFNRKVKIIQLWHGTGTIKKFGQDVNTGQLERLEHNANQTITHLIVNSVTMKEQYAHAFGISLNKVFAYGLPRTDVLLQKKSLSKLADNFYKKHTSLRDKQLILYAPTFRDSQTLNPKIEIDFSKFLEQLPEDYILILKLHPHVAEHFQLSEYERDIIKHRVYNFSNNNINELMEVSTLLITDYSSIAFDYCLQEKPIIFYAYDLEEFSEFGRGFYERYETFVPGIVAKNTLELIESINKVRADVNLYQNQIIEFKNKYYDKLDGRSTIRVASLFKI